jgi:hypothetical protein
MTILRSLLPPAAALLLSACAADTPQVSGFAFGDTRMVSVGDVVELRIPLEADGTREWRVSSYDSLYLALVGRPSVDTDAAGRSSLVFSARAKTRGRTTVELEEVPGPRTEGRPPRTMRFKISIGR